MALSRLASLRNAQRGDSLGGASRLAETARLRCGLVSRKQTLRWHKPESINCVARQTHYPPRPQDNI